MLMAHHVSTTDSTPARPVSSGRALSPSGGACGLERALRYATAAFDRRLVGGVFGGYRLERVLGQGRFGTGFLACSLESCGRGSIGAGGAAYARPGRSGLVFMKLVKPRLRGRAHAGIDENAVWAECAALSLCDHPGIPRWLGIVNEQGRYFVVESLMPGMSLSWWLKRGRAFSDAEVFAIGHKLIDVASHAASRGVVHGDIRPANVLVSFEGAPRAIPAASPGCAVKGAMAPAFEEASSRVSVSLADFGLAAFFDRSVPDAQRMAACVPDSAGIAETIIHLLYACRMHVCAGLSRSAPWFEALILTRPQRSFLDDAFAGRMPSFEDMGRRFDAAFGRAV